MSFLSVIKGEGHTPAPQASQPAQEPELQFVGGEPEEPQEQQSQEASIYPPDLQAWLDAGNSDIEGFYAKKYAAQPVPAPVSTPAPQPTENPFDKKMLELQENLVTTRENIRTAEGLGAVEMVTKLRQEEARTIGAIAHETSMEAIRQQEYVSSARERVIVTFDQEYAAMLQADFGLDSKPTRKLTAISELPLSPELILQLEQSPALRLMAAKVAAYDELKSRATKRQPAPRQPNGNSPSAGQQRQQPPQQQVRTANADFLRGGFGKKEGK